MLLWVPAAGSGGVRARLGRLAACAHPTSSAGQAARGEKANAELTSNPDHPMGADHVGVACSVSYLGGYELASSRQDYGTCSTNCVARGRSAQEDAVAGDQARPALARRGVQRGGAGSGRKPLHAVHLRGLSRGGAADLGKAALQAAAAKLRPAIAW